MRQPFDLDMWTQSSVNYFHEKSWRNLMPVLLPLTYNWDLNRSIIYPVIKVGTEPKVGPFGSVCMDTVHQEHQRYVSINNVSKSECCLNHATLMAFNR